MSVGGISTYSDPVNNNKNDKAPGATPGRGNNKSTMTMDSFMLLLAVQLQNQDMTNPMSNAEMMGQLTSMATVQSMNTFTELSSTQYAMGMMGQTVTVATMEDGKLVEKTGLVTGIDLANMKLYLKDDDTAYGLGNIMKMGEVPKPKDDEDDEKPEQGPIIPPDPDKPVDPDKPADPDKPVDPDKPAETSMPADKAASLEANANIPPKDAVEAGQSAKASNKPPTQGV